MKRWLLASAAIIAPVGWIAGASAIWCAGTGRPFQPPYLQWWEAVSLGWWHVNWWCKLWIGVGAVVPSLVAAAVGYGIVKLWPLLPDRKLVPIERGTSDNHGHADYLSIPEMQALFPAVPDSEVGGVVVGEVDRVDLGPAANIRFDPDNRRTWRNGGNAPLLIDQCKRGSTHSMVIGGSGTYKSTALVTSLLTWTKSIFCLDPKEELADLVGAELADRGRKVIRLEIGGGGPNVLEGIDITSPLAETRLRAIVGRITGPLSGNDKDEKFKRWGQQIILALLCHMMWDTAIPLEMKTLRTLREGLDGGSDVIRDRLHGIADNSPSPLARSLASGLWGIVKDTFDGALMNATGDTEWLASDNYSNLVSGDAYRMSELVDGNLVVFCQVPMEALEHTPAVARVLVGCHLDAVFAAKGRVNGRVFFPIDEAVLIGRDPALKIARDQGRGSKITLQLFYQSEGQIDEIWTPAGRRTWFDGLSWRTYAGVQNLESAKELSAIMGTYAAQATSKSDGRSRTPMGLMSSSLNAGSSEHEISRELAKPHELLAGMRDDERITLIRNNPPMRHGAAIAFRRDEMAILLGQTSYRERQSVPVAAE